MALTTITALKRLAAMICHYESSVAAEIGENLGDLPTSPIGKLCQATDRTTIDRLWIWHKKGLNEEEILGQLKARIDYKPQARTKAEGEAKALGIPLPQYNAARRLSKLIATYTDPIAYRFDSGKDITEDAAAKALNLDKDAIWDLWRFRTQDTAEEIFESILKDLHLRPEEEAQGNALGAALPEDGASDEASDEEANALPENEASNEASNEEAMKEEAMKEEAMKEEAMKEEAQGNAIPEDGAMKEEAQGNAQGAALPEDGASAPIEDDLPPWDPGVYWRENYWMAYQIGHKHSIYLDYENAARSYGLPGALQDWPTWRKVNDAQTFEAFLALIAKEELEKIAVSLNAWKRKERFWKGLLR